MTTATTPAADVPSDVQLMVALYQQIKEGVARESALVAERDALRAALQAVHGELKLAWSLHALPANVISAKTTQACAAALALAAPAVEGV